MKKYFKANNLSELCNIMGLPQSEAPKIKVRIELAKAIRKSMEKNNLTHAEASKKTQIGRTVITAIVNGNLDKISTDRLMDIAISLGVRFNFKVA